MTDWRLKSQTFGNDDKSWLGSAFGVDMGLPIELDLASFDFTTNFPNGFLPSGIVLGKFAGSDKYGHYDPGTIVQESYSVNVNATAGTFTLTFDGETTAALAFNISAANLKLALEGLSNVNVNDFTVTGGPGQSGGGLPYVITATSTGQFGDQNLPDMTSNPASLTGGGASAVVTVTQGGGTAGGVTDSGLRVARGHLLFPVDVADMLTGLTSTTGPATAALLSIGRVRENKLPTNHRLDAAAKLALPRIEYVTL